MKKIGSEEGQFNAKVESVDSINTTVLTGQKTLMSYTLIN